MTDATRALEVEFERRLAAFRRQVDDVARCLYAETTINERASRSGTTLRAINRTPAFWIAVSGGLQMAAIVGMARIFDPKRQHHSVDTMLRFAEQHLELFSTNALGARKRRAMSIAEQHLAAILERAYVPTVEDFRRLGRKLRHHRQTYHAQFKDIRHLHFAHTVVIEPDELHAMFGKTRIRDLERAVMFLTQLEIALRNLYDNGAKPRLSPLPWSVRSLARRPYHGRRRRTVPEEIVSDTKACLRLFTRGAASPSVISRSKVSRSRRRSERR